MVFVDIGSHYRLAYDCDPPPPVSSVLGLQALCHQAHIKIVFNSLYPLIKSDRTKCNRNAPKSHRFHQSEREGLGDPSTVCGREPHGHPKHQGDFYLQSEKGLTFCWTAQTSWAQTERGAFQLLHPIFTARMCQQQMRWPLSPRTAPGLKGS